MGATQTRMFIGFCIRCGPTDIYHVQEYHGIAKPNIHIEGPYEIIHYVMTNTRADTLAGLKSAMIQHTTVGSSPLPPGKVRAYLLKRTFPTLRQVYHGIYPDKTLRFVGSTPYVDEVAASVDAATYDEAVKTVTNISNLLGVQVTEIPTQLA